MNPEPLVVTPAKTVRIYDKKVLVAFPWYKSTHPLTAFSVMQLVDRRRTATALGFGDAFIAHNRNNIADSFLASGLDWLLTIDDDTIVPFGDAAWFREQTGWLWYPEPFASFNILDRLMSHGKTLVGALYFGRSPKGLAVYAESPKEPEYARGGPHDQVKPTNWVGTGAMLIHRTVFEDIEKKFPALARGNMGKGGNWFSSSEHNLLAGVTKVKEMLSVGAMDGEKSLKAYQMIDAVLREAKHTSPLGVGEDVTLCRRAREAGHQPYVDMGLIVGHVGHCCYGPRNTGLK